jgi:hypothetical protein
MVLGVESVREACSAGAEGSELRALLSGEMLVVATSRPGRNLLLELMQGVQGAFDEGRVREDLGMLIASDVLEKVSRGTNEKSVALSEGEFQGLAAEAMRKRRVEPCLRTGLVPVVRKTLCAAR